MRLKYIIEKKHKNNKLLVKEYGLLDKDAYSLMNEVEYDRKMLSAAKHQGEQALIDALRTPNMYPPAVFAGRIAEGVAEILASKRAPSIEIQVDDLEGVDRKRRVRRNAIPIAEEAEDLDGVDDTIEDCDDETCSIKKEDTASDLVEAFPFDEVA